MPKVPVTIEVPKEFHELADGLVTLVSVLKTKLADGWQMSDAPALFAAVTAFLPSLKGIEQLGPEAKDDPEAFVICGTLAIAGIVKDVRS